MKLLYYASGLGLAFVLGGVTVRPFKAATPPAADKYPSMSFTFETTDDLNAYMETFRKDGIWNFGPDGSFPHVRTVSIDNFYAPPCEGRAKFVCSGVEDETYHGPHPRKPQ